LRVSPPTKRVSGKTQKEGRPLSKKNTGISPGEKKTPRRGKNPPENSPKKRSISPQEKL